jgi:hypothetical protein
MEGLNKREDEFDEDERVSLLELTRLELSYDLTSSGRNKNFLIRYRKNVTYMSETDGSGKTYTAVYPIDPSEDALLVLMVSPPNNSLDLTLAIFVYTPEGGWAF